MIWNMKKHFGHGLLSKKRYVGILYEDYPNKGKMKFMIVLKRRDNAPIVKDIWHCCRYYNERKYDQIY